MNAQELFQSFKAIEQYEQGLLSETKVRQLRRCAEEHPILQMRFKLVAQNVLRLRQEEKRFV